MAGLDDCRGAGVCAGPGMHSPPLVAMLLQAEAQAGGWWQDGGVEHHGRKERSMHALSHLAKGA